MPLGLLQCCNASQLLQLLVRPLFSPLITREVVRKVSNMLCWLCIGSTGLLSFSSNIDYICILTRIAWFVDLLIPRWNMFWCDWIWLSLVAGSRSGTHMLRWLNIDCVQWATTNEARTHTICRCTPLWALLHNYRCCYVKVNWTDATCSIISVEFLLSY